MIYQLLDFIMSSSATLKGYNQEFLPMQLLINLSLGLLSQNRLAFLHLTQLHIFEVEKHTSAI